MKRIIAALIGMAALGAGSAVASAPPTSHPTVTIECREMTGPVYDPEYDYWEAVFIIDRVALDFSEPWSTDFPDDAFCDVKAVNGASSTYYIETPETPIEQAEWESTDPEYQKYTLGISYSQCVENGTLWTAAEWPTTIGQAEEALDSLAYCPDHPDRAAIEERIAVLGVEQAEAEAGVRFGDGIYRVGEQIQPGTYFSESDDGLEDCYWERQDSAGRPIDNHFGTALRVEVTIQSTDYAFLTDDCGTWTLVP